MELIDVVGAHASHNAVCMCACSLPAEVCAARLGGGVARVLAAGTTDCEKIEEHQTHIHTHTDTAARVCQPTMPGKGNECAVKLCKQSHSHAVPPEGQISMRCKLHSGLSKPKGKSQHTQ